ncbi:hypothetical protein TNCV_2745831 [Trichonephila clavipes]|nr:hypothetical protein TNCV_2745831 [Trichonephila clavipes]
MMIEYWVTSIESLRSTALRYECRGDLRTVDLTAVVSVRYGPARKTRGHRTTPLRVKADIEDVSSELGNWKVRIEHEPDDHERSTCTLHCCRNGSDCSEAASETNSAREAARRGLPPSSVRNILRRILQLYPYKLQSCHELCQQIKREAFAKWAFSKMEQIPPGF